LEGWRLRCSRSEEHDTSSALTMPVQSRPQGRGLADTFRTQPVRDNVITAAALLAGAVPTDFFVGRTDDAKLFDAVY